MSALILAYQKYRRLIHAMAEPCRCRWPYLSNSKTFSGGRHTLARLPRTTMGR